MMRLIALFFVLLMSMSVVVAQDDPVATEEVPPVDTTTTGTEPAQPSAQSENIFGESLSELINLRNDLELLATAVKGTVRPDGWSGNLDVTNRELPLLIRLDLELLVADTLGFDVPDGWFGIAITDVQYQVRDMRHDIELLADELVGEASRPNGWAGNPNPLWECDRAVQTLVRLFSQGEFFVPSADPTADNYCDVVELQVIGFAEQSIFTIDTTDTYFTAGVRTAQPGSAVVNSDFAVGFFDIQATQRAAVIPNGTPITPVGRNGVNEFSRMVLFEGDGFLLYSEYPFTSLTEEEFDVLPPAPAVQTFCTADWC